MIGTDDGALVTRNCKLLTLVISPTTGSLSVKAVSVGSGVFDQRTNAWFVADSADSGRLIVVLVWFTSPRCTLTPVEYSATYHWMFMVEVSVVARTNSTELEFTRRPRIIEPPGTPLLWRVLKIRNEFVGFTPTPSVTVFVPLPVLVNVPLCTVLTAASVAEVKMRFKSLPDWLNVNVPAPTLF